MLVAVVCLLVLPQASSTTVDESGLVLIQKSASRWRRRDKPGWKAHWLHVPKSGSSFETTIVHYACPAGLPDNLTVQDPGHFFREWGSLCGKSKFAFFEDGHEPLPHDADLSEVVLMMRRPRQRILSGYYANPERLHDCASLQAKYHCTKKGTKCDGDTGVSGSYITDPSRIPPVEYAKCVQNCSTWMLTGKLCNHSGDAPDTDLAIQKIQKIRFVGLSDEWLMTVCLFHAMFGDTVLAAELQNVRPGASSSARGYDEKALLGNWQPYSEDVVYEAAVTRFWNDVKVAGLSRKSCESLNDHVRHSHVHTRVTAPSKLQQLRQRIEDDKAW